MVNTVVVSMLRGVEGGIDSIMRQGRPRLVVNTAHPVVLR
jgi:hypothetical protein